MYIAPIGCSLVAIRYRSSPSTLYIRSSNAVRSTIPSYAARRRTWGGNTGVKPRFTRKSVPNRRRAASRRARSPRRYTKPAPAAFRPRSKYASPRDSVSSPWGFSSNFGTFGFPQRRTSTLSASVAPGGTLSWRRFGSRSIASRSFLWSSSTRASRALIRSGRSAASRILAEASRPAFFSSRISDVTTFRWWRRPSSSRCASRHSRSHRTASSRTGRRAVSPRFTRFSRITSGRSRRRFTSSIGRDPMWASLFYGSRRGRIRGNRLSGRPHPAGDVPVAGDRGTARGDEGRDRGTAPLREGRGGRDPPRAGGGRRPRDRALRAGGGPVVRAARVPRRPPGQGGPDPPRHGPAGGERGGGSGPPAGPPPPRLAPRARPGESRGVGRRSVRVRPHPRRPPRPGTGGRARVLGPARRDAEGPSSGRDRTAPRGSRGPRVPCRRDAPVGLLVPRAVRPLRPRRLARRRRRCVSAPWECPVPLPSRGGPADA